MENDPKSKIINKYNREQKIANWGVTLLAALSIGYVGLNMYRAVSVMSETTPIVVKYNSARRSLDLLNSRLTNLDSKLLPYIPEGVDEELKAIGPAGYDTRDSLIKVIRKIEGDMREMENSGEYSTYISQTQNRDNLFKKSIDAVILAGAGVLIFISYGISSVRKKHKGLRELEKIHV